MIQKIGTVSVFVSDQDRALEFYSKKLGFEVQMDQAMGPDAPRWIQLAPKGAQTGLVLYKPTEGMPGATSYEKAMSNIGTFTTFTFEVEDMEATHKELSGRGVEFVDQPSKQDWGWWATIKDPDGNTIGLHAF